MIGEIVEVNRFGNIYHAISLCNDFPGVVIKVYPYIRENTFPCSFECERYDGKILSYEVHGLTPKSLFKVETNEISDRYISTAPNNQMKWITRQIYKKNEQWISDLNIDKTSLLKKYFDGSYSNVFPSEMRKLEDLKKKKKKLRVHLKPLRSSMGTFLDNHYRGQPKALGNYNTKKK